MRTSRRWAALARRFASARPPSGISLTASGRPGCCVTPAPPCPWGRTSTRSSTCSRRPVRWRCTSVWTRCSVGGSGRASCCRPPPDTRASAGTTPVGLKAELVPTWLRSGSTAPGPPGALRARSSCRPPVTTVLPSTTTVSTSAAVADICLATSGRCCRRRLAPSGRTHDLGRLRNAAVIVQDGLIAWVGPASRAPEADGHRDVGGRAVIPGFVDSHSHLVFAGDRSAEFAARMTGVKYDGGGIANSVWATRAASEDDLRALVGARIEEMRAQGTTTVEIKSGYGLSVEDEARSLRIAAEFTSETTFLGAHVVPPEYVDRRAEYVDLVTGQMLSACAPYARWI